ncbi:cyclic pyranopterin monophosphate synthase MoaC [Mycobacteroides abscessus]|uniref:Cyclic pyranopterin monophosphate synthase n=1 Tax=Mycobacteroides abscessus (strain ATCC 19977 / DSM 44196 / CCUG 20993 / CIP 104536 / JCM 13569 / NCTC 13031 / TMC 1543 / L948) TaxID=561007 RepID=B1MJ02_MYCA9|nr:cyclic pyranopterin monophosphate synthase MoaC [Mycobacteroides abscessus]MCU8691794.1 cyclic pyranopterin monophosphate synthase MoaC [Mycobacteroides abscessus]MCU8711003.1 cyclic pyranopterin monophosphate synthase MoaC [Mycobacteroides abscessus]MCU8715749.1 cyclic pyranopterin monophosphate synthase MoaC [Mycobacteroides abscessus]MCU8749764.1 cyclic pyranopterin monophosphate synthase MoaC [Mycobacteroides abscessus]MCU8760278.1 cyclic pyranopterin monophosphate synthase MoaC [Mycoba
MPEGLRASGSSGPEGLSHIDEHGSAHMVDVSAKQATAREAVAAGRFVTTPEVLKLLSDGTLPKGDAIATARLAAIMAAKRTSELIPLCHQIPLTGIEVDFAIDATAGSIQITAVARTKDRTGVEMEALTAVTVAGLTLHDMVKAVDPASRIDDVRVLRKEGGKTGTWTRP